MGVKTHASGRRFVELELECPGTPEDVWQAIATGAGISSWFVPTDVEPRLGGAVAFHLGDGMESLGQITAWEPPRRFTYEEPDWAPNAPPLASEFTIEPRAGGTCVIRLVHSLFTSTEDWDDQLESIESGWPPFFDVLRMYLGHFAGQPSSVIRLAGKAAGSEEEAWNVLRNTFGLNGASPGQPWRMAITDAGPLAGVVLRIGRGTLREMLVKLEEPASGAAIFGVYTWGTQVMLSISLYLYGPLAARIVARDEPRWREWLQHTPLVAPAHAPAP
jgi:uncharacterized protein YndB with AHSA1/START domain